MKKFISCLLLLASLTATAQKTYKYESFDGDPLKARIYTLDNGLKVYLTINRNEPRIQTYIAVRTGSKNDPAETTGLAHYLEHLLFKGTTQFGTQNYEAERPLLDSIRNLYEVYRRTTDTAERKAIYHRIDSISGVASTFAIANEYDKLMAAIGANGTNAHTSEDETVYQEDIPSNEVENWAIVQSNRFKDMVIRGFHTELEAVYEEYNRGLTNDFWKIFEKLNAMLFPSHPYGKQTTIGTQEHLKNPSIVNIENYFRKYYVPNNVAICMSGDLDMDETIGIIDRYFGDWKRGDDPQPLKVVEEKPFEKPEVAEIFGPQMEMVVLGWRMPGLSKQESELVDVLNEVLKNGKTGLFDVDLTMQQKILEAEVFPEGMTDHTAFCALGLPKEGQTLDQVKDLMLEEIGKVMRGEFDEQMLQGIINNKKLDDMKQRESNVARASRFYHYFIHGRDWQDFVTEDQRLSAVTKQQVVDFANRYLSTQAYALIYKRQGTDPNEKKIDKPAISPIEMNRDKTSQFVTQLTARPLKPIEPVFMDMDEDVNESKLKNGTTLLYRQNTENGRFKIIYRTERGNKHDHLLPIATDYIEYLGTDKKSQEEIAAELYRLACDISFSCGQTSTTVTVSGLAENQKAALKLMGEWIAKAQPDQEIYDELVQDHIKAREIGKSDENTCFQHLMAYAQYGPVNNLTDQATADELRKADPKDVLQRLRQVAGSPHIISYYGPSSKQEVAKLIGKTNKLAKQDKQTDVWSRTTLADQYPQVRTEADEVLLAPYESKAVKLAMLSDNGQVYDPSLDGDITLFNEYFGGSMNAIVFQELREARGLAYSAGAYYRTPSYRGGDNIFVANIGSQNDKLADCLDVFHEIIEHMPVAQNSFDLAKDAVLKRLSTNRIVADSNLNYYYYLRKMKFDHDVNADIYQRVKNMTIDDLLDFSKQNVAGRKYRFAVLGDEQNLNMTKLESLGNVRRLTLEDIFGF